MYVAHLLSWWLLHSLSFKGTFTKNEIKVRKCTQTVTHITTCNSFFPPHFSFYYLFIFFQCVLHLVQKSPSSTVFDHKQSALGIYMSKTEISMLVQLSGEHLLSIYVSTSICYFLYFAGLFLKATNNSLLIKQTKAFLFLFKKLNNEKVSLESK